ncbi:hypothetical protein G4Y79_09235 [Phototrophicus methaneseepsis]|uniref:Uncharacterized protein n=1 Tax=Phototrophicus methaneseepsis TaxID=2710758 RepID=A0A7S8IGE9_9CHLR|nr:hypothetical protein [Phototrophicus methaneseepsis]QPC84539.1 hypothetical protein G4Y79_09235 [Phototrophicus methaneseepsis]
MNEIDFAKIIEEIAEVLKNNGIDTDTFALNVHLSTEEFDRVVSASQQPIQGYEPPIRRAYVRHNNSVFHMLGGFRKNID